MKKGRSRVLRPTRILFICENNFGDPEIFLLEMCYMYKLIFVGKFFTCEYPVTAYFINYLTRSRRFIYVLKKGKHLLMRQIATSLKSM